MPWTRPRTPCARTQAIVTALALGAALALAIAYGAPILAFAQTSPPPGIPGAGGSLIAPPDPNNAAFYGEMGPLTVGQAGYVQGRSLKAVCTVAGNVVVSYFDGSTGTWPVSVGTQTFPIAVTEVISETASCVFTNLK